VKLLLDTHVLLWVRGYPERLKVETSQLLADPANEVFVSIVSLWEIVVKCRIGKLKVDVAAIVAKLSPRSKLQLLGITPRHLTTLNSLPFHKQHRDPFDHLLIAQAVSEGMMLMTDDRHAALYPVGLLAP
jgi:PIN domain nuclease of toxin-antitoxin system